MKAPFDTQRTAPSKQDLTPRAHRLAPFRRPLAAVAVVAMLAVPRLALAQVLQQWTHQATIGEASAAIAMDANYMFVADNEDETLRLYARFPETSCTPPVYALNVRASLNLSSSNPEADLEAGVRWTDDTGTRLYWLGSHSNSKSGNARPNRLRLFATQVAGDGTGPTPYSLTYVGRYDRLRDDLTAWDRNNLHGLGANYFALAASTNTGVLPTRIDGFNIEGLVLAPDGATAYLAFRAPLVNGSGPTTSLAQRTHALIVPVLNLPALVAGSPTAGPGLARFGTPITLDLGGRGVRSIDSSHPGHYLITAGPTADVSNPPSPPNNFRLYTWTGNASDAPVERMTEIPYGFEPEGAVLPPGPITRATVVQFVSDDTGGCFRSFAAYVGPNVGPSLTVVAAGGQIRVSWPAAATGYGLQFCTDLREQRWQDCPTTPSGYGTAELTVAEPADGIRFYRLIRP